MRFNRASIWVFIIMASHVVSLASGQQQQQGDQQEQQHQQQHQQHEEGDSHSPLRGGGGGGGGVASRRASDDSSQSHQRGRRNTQEVTTTDAGTIVETPPEMFQGPGIGQGLQADANGRVRVYVTFQPGRKGHAKAAATRAGAEILYEFDFLNALAVSVPQQALEGLGRNPNVASIEEDPARGVMVHSTGGEMFHQEEPASRRRLQNPPPPGVVQVQAPDAWAAGFDGTGVKVCTIDSGVYRNHNEFDTKYSTTQGFNKGTNYWYVDRCSHGTHVAGTILGDKGDIYNGYEMVGVAPGSTLYAVKVFGYTWTTSCIWSWDFFSSDLISAAQKCKDAGAKIVNMSLGGSGSSTVESAGFQSMYQNDGMLFIAAAGNGGSSDFSYPASYDSVMSVAAIDASNTKASFSQFNSQVEIAARGVSVLSSIWDSQYPNDRNRYASWDGTSMATPHVVGVAALVKQAAIKKYGEANVTPQMIRDAICNTALDLGDPGRDDKYGFGVAQALAAINSL